jgi:hypothetical protein
LCLHGDDTSKMSFKDILTKIQKGNSLEKEDGQDE